MRKLSIASLLLLLLISASATAADANRLTYLDEFCDPYYVGRDFAKLTTPQWVGEEGVEAVVVLAIDDMRDSAKYEAYLRPILERLKKIDGRAPVSIMTNRVDPADPQLQKWLAEGLSLEIHTYDHPCPCLQGGDFAKAKETYEKCVDLLASVDGNKPVAFRMPCCDSLNTPSPRFYQEIFNRTTSAGNYLQVDSSVFNITTSQDTELPHSITLNDEGQQRFRRYLPFPSFVNTIEDYPYPYVIGGLCWQFPCAVPSDWEAQNIQQPNNPATVRDMQLAIDATVIKQGVFNLVFHPHGWIRNDQVVELIDHAVAKHGNKVKFLTFREALDRMNEHLLAGHPLRSASGGDNGVRLLDANNDGCLDVVIANKAAQLTRIWSPDESKWIETSFPLVIADSSAEYVDVWAGEPRFGVLRSDGNASVLHYRQGVYSFDGEKWIKDEQYARGLPDIFQSDYPAGDLGIRLRDLDGDGCCELLLGDKDFGGVYHWSPDNSQWQKLPFKLPQNTKLVDDRGRDAGLRFVDVDEDGHDDVLFSDEQRYSLHLFDSLETGWSIAALSGNRGDEGAVPPIVRGETNNGAWFHSGQLWVQNEDTNRLPDGVDRLAFADMLKDHREREAKQSAPPTQVGAAKIDITPEFPIRLSGYGNRRSESEGIAQKIWAKAVAIGAGKDAAVLVTLENCGAPAHLHEAVAKALAEKAGIAPEQIVVACTHTHSAPLLNRSLPFMFGEPITAAEQAHVERYSADLEKTLIAVASEALDNRQPAKLYWAQGNVGFAGNRRVLQSGKWAGFGQQAGGPVDHSLPILVAKNTDGQPIAVVANYACHCTTLGGDFNQIAGDWAGYAMEYIEQDHPGAIALVTIGCGADANPQPRGGLEMCQQHGRALADETARLLKGDLAPLDAQLRCRREQIELPFAELPTVEQWKEKAQAPGAAGRHGKHFLELAESGGEIPHSIPYPVATWSFGKDLALVFLPGEVVVDYAIRLKQEFDAERLWITAYANDTPCYIASQRILREGGYEADSSMIYYGQPTRLSNDVEDLIVDAVQRILPQFFYSQAKLLEFPPPKTPEESIPALKLRPGMKAELVAAEPLIVDPVAFDWGPDGKLWVVEMHDYPDGVDGQGKPGGRVRVLSDDDNDGRYDRAVTFLEDLPFPTGVKVWRQGALITAAPEIFFAQDTDGDGKADVRKTLYSGFGEGNQQHRVNGLRWGLDNWLYIGNGDSGGDIKSQQTGESAGIGGRDLRIRPDDGALDPQSGQTQYGRCRDDWGNWFGGNNSNPLWHYVLDDGYLRRNPHLSPPDGRKHVSVEPGAAPVFPASRTLARFNDFNRADRFTSACSPIIYRDTLLGAEFYGNSFVCEPVHNLVHREIVETDGFTFTSRRANDEAQSEFLASTDNWFRPAMVRTGPDGALWVCDMYRFVIEHPKWIPMSFQRKLDLRAGDNMGRIYRIYPEGKTPRPLPRLDKLDTPGLVDALDSENGWRRDLAQELLVTRADKNAAPLLEKMARSAERPLTRLHALCTLDGLQVLSNESLLAALADVHPGVRRHALRLSENRFNDSPDLVNAALALRSETDPQTQLQLAYSLGAISDARAGQALAELALAHADDQYLTAAVFSSIHQGNLGSFAAQVLKARGNSSPPPNIVEQLLSLAAAIGDREGVNSALGVIVNSNENRPEQWRLDSLAAVLDALDRRKKPLDDVASDDTQQAVSTLLQQSRTIAADTSAAEPLRIAAIRLLLRVDRGDDDIKTLGDLLTPQQSPSVQAAAVESLARLPAKQGAAVLLAGWPAHTPALRAQVLDLLLRRGDSAAALLDAIDSGQVAAAHLDARRRQQLLRYRDDDLRRRAEQILNTAGSGDRKAIVEQYAHAANLPADVERGKQVFAKRCAGCHVLENVGHIVGPDLTALTDKSPQAMLVAMFDPNRAVEDKFLDYAVITVDGRQFSGILTNETANSITLSAQDGKQLTLLRSEIDEMRNSGKSLMPEGVEKDVTAQDAADVIAYVRSIGAPRKEFPGNAPKVAHVRDDGSIHVLASDSAIYGPSLVFEQHYRNLGYWQSDQDRAVWTIDAPHAGQYAVSLDYACHDSAAGDTLLLSVAGQTLGWRVEGSGTWDNYRGASIGIVTLPDEPVELLIRSDGPIRSALIDLRGLRLTPRN